MSKRFKTKKEIELEYGGNWSSTKPKDGKYYFASQMELALGEPFNKTGSGLTIPRCGTSTFFVEEWMLTEEPLIPIGSKVAIPLTKMPGTVYAGSHDKYGVKQGFFYYNGISDNKYHCLSYNKSLGNYYYASEILEAYERYKENSKTSMELILEEAKLKYPIGTKFYAVHRDGTVSSILSTQNQECFIYDHNWIIGSANIRTPEGKWAKVLEEIKSEVTSEIKIGSYVRCKPGFDTTDNSNNKGGHGYKVGDKFLINNIFNDIAWGKNHNGGGVYLQALELITKEEYEGKEDITKTLEAEAQAMMKDVKPTPIVKDKEYYIKLAKEKGFVDGVTFKGVDGMDKDIPRVIDYSKIEFNSNYGCGLHQGNSWLVLNDKWGEIIKDSKEDTFNYLVKEAKKRFALGAKFIGLRDVKKDEDRGNGETVGTDYSADRGQFGDSFSYNYKTDTLYSSGYGVYVIYEKGTWAGIELLSYTERQLPDKTLFYNTKIDCKNEKNSQLIQDFLLNKVNIEKGGIEKPNGKNLRLYVYSNAIRINSLNGNDYFEKHKNKEIPISFFTPWIKDLEIESSNFNIENAPDIALTGEEHSLKGFQNILLNYGYKNYEPYSNYTRSSPWLLTNFGGGGKRAIGYNQVSGNSRKEFILPKQYNEALAYLGLEDKSFNAFSQDKLQEQLKLTNQVLSVNNNSKISVNQKQTKNNGTSVKVQSKITTVTVSERRGGNSISSRGIRATITK